MLAIRRSFLVVSVISAVAGGGVALAATLPATVRFPVDCGKGVRLVTLNTRRLSPEPGLSRTLVLVQCDLMDGSGHAALLAYGAKNGSSTLTQTLVAPRSGLYPWFGSAHKSVLVVYSQQFVSLAVYAYSSARQARAKPDVFTVLSWRWAKGSFHLLTKAPPHEAGY